MRPFRPPGIEDDYVMTKLRANGNKDFIFDGWVDILQVNEEDIHNN